MKKKINKVLVTGAAGFIGSHLVQHCYEMGYQVRAMIHYNSKNSWGWLETLNIRDRIEVYCGRHPRFRYGLQGNGRL